MTDDTARLDAIEARAKAATPGPWNVDGPFWVDPPGVTPSELTVQTRAGVSGKDRALVMEGTWDSKDANAEHIAGLDPEMALWLVGLARASHTKDAEIERLNERLARYERTIDLARVERGQAEDAETAATERAEAAERERDDARAEVRASRKSTDAALAIVGALEEAVENDCGTDPLICHDYDRTDGACSLVMDLRRIRAAIEGRS